MPIEALFIVAIFSLLVASLLVIVSLIRVKSDATLSLGDLDQIRSSLESYKRDGGSYPVSCGFEGYLSFYDCPEIPNAPNPCWIVPLGNMGDCPLPRERTGNTDGMSQYVYKSNGRDYKLIYVNPPSLSVPSERYDPARLPGKRGLPSAYGYWTAGAKNW